jgi:hypothetical protein
MIVWLYLKTRFKVLLLFITQSSNNGANDHRGPESSNEKLSDLLHAVSIVLIKCIYIRSLQPITRCVNATFEFVKGCELSDSYILKFSRTHHEGVHKYIIISQLYKLLDIRA